MKRKSKSFPDVACDGISNLDYLYKAYEGLTREQHVRLEHFFLSVLSASMTAENWRGCVDQASRLVVKYEKPKEAPVTIPTPVQDTTRSRSDYESRCIYWADCGVIVGRDDEYFDTPCGTICLGCMENIHSKTCATCRAEFNLQEEITANA